jgi:hypothetical protein
MLLLYSLILKWIKLFIFFTLINLHTIPHNDKAKTGLTFLQIYKKFKSDISHLPGLYRRDGARFPPDVTLGILAKDIHLGFI